MLASQLALSNANANTPRDCGFWCWVDEYLPCSCGYGPCKLRSATGSKKRFYCCPFSKSKQERGCGFFKWFDDVNGESSTFTPATSATPTFTTSTTIEDLEVNSEARKYKTAPLQHRDLLEKMFKGLSATGDFAWSSGMTSVPPSTQQTEYVPLPDDTNVDETQVSHAGVDYPWEGEAIPSYDVPISPGREPTPGSTSRTPMSQVGGQTQSKMKRPATTVQPVESSELVQSLICALTAQGSSSTSQSSDDHSSEVLRVLKDMVSSYEMDNVLFFKSLKFLGGSNEHIYRMMFLGLDPEQRVGFLEALLG
ncbi:hypothetical protein GIB67_002196 [Kingdonia uniflora]|uniref:Zinc finger GRF-type domain-containing protein n=1 Tax=Kingdonia uniflora TaxID=39325 RepID=A0A7J7KWN2_9MAGN|nr:hypothetical protein GIB67_002196 [Kingdonia uniflora]